MLEQVGVAEELRDLDEERARQARVLLGVLVNEADVVAQARIARGDHPPLKASLDGRRLVRREVDARALAYLVEEHA